MASGVKVDPSIIPIINSCGKSGKSKAGSADLRGMVLQFNSEKDPTAIIQREDTVLRYSGENSNLREFLDKVKKLGPCYVLFVALFQTDSLSDKPVHILLKWCEDNTKIKQKMLIAASFDAVKAQCDTFNVKIQATEPDDLSYTGIYNAIPKGVENVTGMEGVPRGPNKRSVEFNEPKSC